MAKVTLKQNGNIEVKAGALTPRIIGKWIKEDVWAQNGGRCDKSGNKLVRYIWNATLRSGLELRCYTRDELEKAIKHYY